MTPSLSHLMPGASSNRRRQGWRSNASPREGFILVAVLIVVLLASMVVVSLLFRVRAEETAAVAGSGSQQAWSTALSGVYEAMRVVAPGSLDWQDNPTAFREHLAFDEGSDRWYFSVYSQGEIDREDVKFGLTDESSKLNINQATEAMFEKLPKMTPYLVQGLLDFLDSDETPRPEGAEQEYYDLLPTPYVVPNKALSSLEELLLVRGFTPALLYGEDANWNFQLDANEDDGEVQFPPDNKDGKLDRGLRALLTVSSYDVDRANDGSPRVDLNAYLQGTSNAALPNEELPPSFALYLEAMQRNKSTLEQPADLLEAKGKFKNEAGQETELESGIGKTELPIVLDRFTTALTQRQPGLININTASSTVLQTLPEIDEALADSIVAARRNLRPEQRRTPAWLYQEGLVDVGQFKKHIRHLTARSFQYRFQVVGYGMPSGRYRVLEAVIDTAGVKPAVTYLRDITRLGLPFRIETDSDLEHPASESTSASRNPVTLKRHG